MARDLALLHRPIVFQTPDRMVSPPSWLEHTPFAFWIVDALRPGMFVELGCHSGNSYSSFAQAVSTLGLPTACYAVDTWRGDPHAGAFDESVFEEWREYHDRCFSSFSCLIRSTFDEAAGHFAEKSIDLLHLDGYHTFEAALHDFQVWRPKISDRGVILCHDIAVRENDFGVWRLWEQLRAEYPSFEFLHGHGLGVLGVGRNLADPIHWLLSLEPDEASIVRMFFARLGAAVLGAYSTAEAEQTLRRERAACDTRVAEAIARDESLTAENSHLREALHAAEEALRSTQTELSAVSARLRTREAERAYPTIVIASHVGCWRPRAGNEYRLNRMCQWYRRQGYRLILVIAPLPGEELSREAVEGTAATFGNVIQVHRDGRREHDLRDCPEWLIPMLDAPAPARAAGDDGASTPLRRELLEIERTFCHDSVVSTLLSLQQALGPHVLQVEYIWMTRIFPLVRHDVLKVVDTHDVFSSAAQKVGTFGVSGIAIDGREEAALLRRADLVIAIQKEEAQELQRLVPAVPVVTAGVDFDVVSGVEGGIDGRIVSVASGNARNRKGVDDFVRLAWPRIRQRVPHARLVIVGSAGEVVADRDIPGIAIMGSVDDVAPIYRDAALVINPVIAGTGVKIKTLEALSHLRPIVTWPAGIDGIDPSLAARCRLARDWYEFANVVVEACRTTSGPQFTAEDRAVIARCLSPETVYADLSAQYRAYFKRHQLTVSPSIVQPVSAGAH